VQAAAFVTAHAIERYQARVDPTASRRAGLRAIREIVADGKNRSKPRHWTNVGARPGCRYVYSAKHPGICLVIRGGAVVTLFSRTTCSQWRPAPDGGAAARSPQPYRRPQAGAFRHLEVA
jgi:hypothetical protein